MVKSQIATQYANLKKENTYIPMVTYIVDMATTISISQELLQELKKRKMYDKESYEEVIWDALEDSMELSEETLANIKKSEADIKAGRVHTLAEVKKELGL